MKSKDRGGVRLCVLVALALLASASMSAAQDKTALSISPSSTTVSPGDTLLVTLRSPADVRFAALTVIWEKEIAGAPTTLPATVSVHIPDETRPGKYEISAIGRTVSNEEVIVGTLVAVERPDLPTRLSTERPTLRFMTLGDELPLSILAGFTGGRVLDVTDSSLVAYTSSNPRVASVDELGMVMAVSPGSASVTATYTQGSASRRLVIPVTVPPPPFSVSPIPLDLGDVAIGSTVSRNITLRNTTEGPLQISSVAVGFSEGFAASDTCTAASPLAIGASCTITVTFTPAAAGRLKTLVWLGGDDSSIRLSVMGTGVSRE